MKNGLFVVSHLGSDSGDLVKSLNDNPRVTIYDFSGLYDHYSSLQTLFGQRHKARDSSAVYGDHLCFNTNFYCSDLYSCCKFIYVISPPRIALPRIIQENNYNPIGSSRYYAYRLRRICEMAKRTPGAVLLRSENMQSKMHLVKDYLGLKSPVNLDLTNDDSEVTVDSSLMSSAEDCYERHLYFLNQQQLVK